MKKYVVRPYSLMYVLQMFGVVGLIIGAMFLTVKIVEVFA